MSAPQGHSARPPTHGLLGLRAHIGGLTSTYGMLAVLGLICLFFTWATFHSVDTTGADGAKPATDNLARMVQPGAQVILVGGTDEDSRAFCTQAALLLAGMGYHIQATLVGAPPDIRAKLESLATQNQRPQAIVTPALSAQWPLWDSLRKSDAGYANLKVAAPGAQMRSSFLTTSNLRNVADQIAVIAIIAVGMTMVIITGGIDLSVGSLVALSAVIAAWEIQRAGGEGASPLAMVGACAAAIVLCAAVGATTGWLVARIKVPPFIVTLAGMQTASGLAFMIARGQSIYQIPAKFTWLGRGAALFTIPNTVVLMALIYVAAHIFMTRTAIGRSIYAVGGNLEAARLSGVMVTSTLVLVYAISAAMAGIGGVVTTSQLSAGAPTYGLTYEMYVIAAVVVGGTSLAGGQGRIFGTLIGAFVIAVIRNGMNLTNVESYTQKVLLGMVILAAVLLDMLRRRVRA